MNGGRAIVIGGSFSGLLSAIVLAKHFAEVLLVERFPVRDGSLEGPRGHQDATHILAAAGWDAIERIAPDLRREAEADGAVTVDPTFETQFSIAGYWLPRSPGAVRHTYLSRARMDSLLRKRVERIPNIVMRSGQRASGLIREPASRGLAGVILSGQKDGSVEERGDLIVDCSGRAALVANTLIREKVPLPREVCEFEYAYTTAMLEGVRPIGDAWKAILLEAAPPDGHRAGFLLPEEGGRWRLSLAGYCGEAAPVEADGFWRYAEDLGAEPLTRALADARLVSPPALFRSREHTWYRYDRIAPPTGLIVVGDALCNFDPVHGQGLSVAARQANLLRTLLTSQRLATSADRARLSRRYFAGASRRIRHPWWAGRNHRAALMGPPPSTLRRLVDGVIARAASVNPQFICAMLQVADRELLVAPWACLHPTVGKTLLQSLLMNGSEFQRDEQNRVSRTV